MPGPRAPLDAHGNLSRRVIGDILTQVQAHTGVRAERQTRAGVRRAAQRRAGGLYFVIQPGQRGLAAGIWLRGVGAAKPVPTLLFVRGATYEARLPFHALASRLAGERLAANFDRAFTESAARLRARG